jgi:hypothetical protein
LALRQGDGVARNANSFGSIVPRLAVSFMTQWPRLHKSRTINPDLEPFMAKRMGAKTIEVKASHLSLISHPTRSPG